MRNKEKVSKQGKHLNTSHGSVKEAIYKVSEWNKFGCDTSLTAITSSLQIQIYHVSARPVNNAFSTLETVSLIVLLLPAKRSHKMKMV